MNYCISRRGARLCGAIVDIIAETGLDLVMKLGFAHDVEICSSRFVIIFDPSGLQLVEFQQLSV